MLPSGSQDRRPCHTGCAICLLVPLFRGPPACARSRPLVRPSPIGPRSLRLVLALALRTVAGHSFCRSRIHLPASLCSTPVTTLPSSYEGSDFHHPVQRETVDLPDSPHLNFSVVLSPTTRCPSMSASLRSFSSRSGLFPDRTVSRLHPSGLWASPLVRRLARTSSRIEFLTYGPTDSPPVALHPTFGGLNSSFPSVTQLPLAFNQSSVWLRGISPPIQMRSRAHECGDRSHRFSCGEAAALARNAAAPRRVKAVTAVTALHIAGEVVIFLRTTVGG